MTSTITRRLTTAFAGVMVAVLLGGGAGVYFGERFSLDRSLRRDVERQGDELRRLVAQPGTVSNRMLRDRPDSYIQVLDEQGTEVAATPPLREQQMLTRSQVAQARRGVHTFQRGSITRRNRHSFRIRTEALTDGGQPRIIVVAIRRDARDEALRELVAQLAGFGLLALALTVLAGYRLTSAAMRPVDDVRRQADALYRGDATGALDVPAGDDEIAALTKTLNELLARIAGTVERERSFSAAASHELRTPLSSLRAELDLALRSPRTHAQLLAAVRDASIDTERLVSLAEDLLLLRTPEVGVGTDVHVLEPIVARVAARAGVPVAVDPWASDIRVVGSSELLARAVQNLIDNARRYAATTVELAIIRGDGIIHIDVTDDGVGFADQLLTSAFEPFRRGAGERSGTGFGLGLAIVDAIMRAHGGSVTASNGPPTKVRLSLPLAPSGAGGGGAGDTALRH